MSDRDDQGSAWRVPPSAYLARRPAQFAVPARPRSRYLTMPDGGRLAVDVHLPARARPLRVVFPLPRRAPDRPHAAVAFPTHLRVHALLPALCAHARRARHGAE